MSPVLNKKNISTLNINKIWNENYSLQCTGIPKVVFRPHHIDHRSMPSEVIVAQQCRATIILVYCCTKKIWYCFETMCFNNDLGSPLLRNHVFQHLHWVILSIILSELTVAQQCISTMSSVPIVRRVPTMGPVPIVAQQLPLVMWVA
jgi:hypothetical protein